MEPHAEPKTKAEALQIIRNNAKLKRSGKTAEPITVESAVDFAAFVNSCCGYALENLVTRNEELDSAREILQIYIDQNADPDVISALELAVAHIEGQVEELGMLRDDQCVD